MKHQPWLVILCSFAALSVGCHENARAEAPLPADLQNGLVLYYTFDRAPATGTIPDASGHGNNGQATGVQWVAAGRNGGGCAQFSLNNSYITVPNNPSLNPPQFTLAAWIKTEYTDSVWRRIFDKGFNKEYALSVSGDWPAGDSWQRGQFELELGVGGAANSGARVADGQWHHVVATFSGSEIRLYADGHPAGYAVRSGRRRTDPSFDLTIGANRSNPNAALGEVGASFDGMMDDVMIYDRALSAGEVQKLFLTQGGVLTTPSPLGEEMPAPANLKYGLYIHYGLPTFARPGQRGEIPASQFAPGKVNVQAWARAAKTAGMTFAVLTVKHESGFSLWDSPGYDYDVSKSPFKGDIINDFIAACNAEGILPGAHYSIPDAHNEGEARQNGPVPELYFNLIKKQITELHTKYPGLRVQIFDGSRRLSPAQWDELCGIVHKLNPQCVVLDTAQPGVVHDISDTIERGWFWRPNAPLMPTTQVFQQYNRAKAGNDAFLLGVGPDPQGDIPDNQLAVLMEMKQLIAQGPAAANASAAAKPDAAERLKTLKSLYDQGLINKDDYDKKVKEIMDSL